MTASIFIENHQSLRYASKSKILQNSSIYIEIPRKNLVKSTSMKSEREEASQGDFFVDMFSTKSA